MSIRLWVMSFSLFCPTPRGMILKRWRCYQDRNPISLDPKGEKNSVLDQWDVLVQEFNNNPALKDQFYRELHNTLASEGLSIENLEEEKKMFLTVFLLDLGINQSEDGPQTRGSFVQRGHVYIASEKTNIEEMAAVLLKISRNASNTFVVPESRESDYLALIRALSQLPRSQFRGRLETYEDIEMLAAWPIDSKFKGQTLVVDKSLKPLFPGTRIRILQDILRKILVDTPKLFQYLRQIKTLRQAIQSAA